MKVSTIFLCAGAGLGVVAFVSSYQGDWSDYGLFMIASGVWCGFGMVLDYLEKSFKEKK